MLVEDDSFNIQDMERQSMIPPVNKFFMVLDVTKGYWNLRVRKEDQVKLSICWRNKNWMFTRLSFGLKNSGYWFCRAIAAALEDMENRNNVKIFIDDILVHAADFDTFAKTVDEVLTRLDKFGFVVNPKKCSILYPQCKWLGRLLSSQGLNADPGNVEAVTRIKSPTSYKSLQSLLGMLNWVRQFASVKVGESIAENSFSHIVKPINELLKINKPRSSKFVWTAEAEEAIERVKVKLTDGSMVFFPTTTFPSFSSPMRQNKPWVTF